MTDNPDEQTTQVQEVGDDEMRIAFAGPAVFSNRFFITLTQSGVRVAFAEQQGGDLPVFRTGVILGFSDALALSGLIKELMDRHVRIESAPTDSHSEEERNG